MVATRDGLAVETRADSEAATPSVDPCAVTVANVRAARSVEGDPALVGTSIREVADANADDEIAVAALFLADPENSYMNGHILTVDGGWTAGYARDF